MKKMIVTVLLGKEEYNSPIELIGVYATDEKANEIFDQLIEQGGYYDVWGEKKEVIR